jgi:signal transduction histidine kinase
VLDAPVDGPEGLDPLVAALAGAAPDVDAVAIAVRGERELTIAAATGLEAAAPFAPGPLVAEAIRTRAPAAAAGAAIGAPLPEGTRAAIAVPALSRGEVLAVVVAGTRSAADVPEDDRLLVRVVAERAGRALERSALVEALSSAEHVARATTSFRDQILGIVGHDLRNPLGAVAMSAALLTKRGGLAGWQSKTVARIRSSTGRMERIIADLLSYTRTRLGSGIPIERRTADLAEVTRRVVDEIAALHPDCPIHVDVEGDLGGEWDAARLEQVVSNLLSNALDHGEPESPVDVELRGADAVRMEVRNRGEMPPSVIAHLFEPFSRPPDRESRRASGLGLGLFIAREIVRGHGGRIDVASRGGETRVWFELPRREARP